MNALRDVFEICGHRMVAMANLSSTHYFWECF
jgi:hypothetical protein